VEKNPNRKRTGKYSQGLAGKGSLVTGERGGVLADARVIFRRQLISLPRYTSSLTSRKKKVWNSSLDPERE